MQRQDAADTPSAEPRPTSAGQPSQHLPAPAGSLRNNHLLASLSSDVIAAVEQTCRWRRLEENDVVFDQDDASRDVFFIVKGRLRILVFRPPASDSDDPDAGATSSNRGPQTATPGPDQAQADAGNDGADTSADDLKAEADSVKAGIVAFEALVDEGAPMTLTEMKAGDTFGELSAIDGRMRSARAVALEPSVVATLDGEQFVRLVRENGEFAVALLQRVAGYLRASNRRMYNLSTLTAKQRVYAQLARLAEVNPTQPDQWLIQPVPSHVDIAFWAGTKRETVAAAIGWLAREGIVVRQNRALLVRQPDRLKALAHV